MTSPAESRPTAGQPIPREAWNRLRYARVLRTRWRRKGTAFAGRSRPAANGVAAGVVTAPMRGASYSRASRTTGHRTVTLPERSPGEQRELDAALAATFPASDPPAATTGTIATLSDPMPAEADASVAPVFRVAHRRDADAPFSSAANRAGGRWTSPGLPVIYASTSPAGAVLEFLAHLDGEKPVDLVLVSARMPERSVAPATSLQANWRDTPYRDDVREYGNAWARSRQSLALAVPSVLCERSRNLLINPEHEDIGQLALESVELFTLDPRLMRHRDTRHDAADSPAR